MVTSEVVVVGRENIPEDFSKRAYIVAVNHLGWAEAPILINTFPSWIYWMTKDTTFDFPILGRILRYMGFFPVTRGEVDREAIKTALNILQNGKKLGIAPEGTRGRQGVNEGLKPARRGIMMFATRADVPVIPTAVWGTENLLPLIDEGISWDELRHFKRPKIGVRIGKVFDLHLKTDPYLVSRQEQEELTERLMQEISRLLPEKYRGVYN
jgi:1-acyl-sn-glycerol-3-phosphate acyltransferase